MARVADDPIAVFPESRNVPAALWVIGKSSVTSELSVCTPVVAANVHIFASAGIVPAVTAVFPYIEIATTEKVAPLALIVKLFVELLLVNVIVPALFNKLKLIAVDVLLIVFVVAPAPVVSTEDVPETVSPVIVLVSQTVSASADEQTILPVPKLRVRVLELLEVNLLVVYA